MESFFQIQGRAGLQAWLQDMGCSYVYPALKFPIPADGFPPNKDFSRGDIIADGEKDERADTHLLPNGCVFRLSGEGWITVDRLPQEGLALLYARREYLKLRVGEVKQYFHALKASLQELDPDIQMSGDRKAIEKAARELPTFVWSARRLGPMPTKNGSDDEFFLVRHIAEVGKALKAELMEVEQAIEESPERKRQEEEEKKSQEDGQRALKLMRKRHQDRQKRLDQIEI